MNWNEKIDRIKKLYSHDKFSVPHINRKDILTQIETKFIKRSKNYYELNTYTGPFINWWTNINSSFNLTTTRSYESMITKLVRNDKNYWVACEGNNLILIYKANLEALIDLCSIGQTYTKTYHIIDMKYNFMISFKIIKQNEVEFKFCGENKAFKNIKDIN